MLQLKAQEIAADYGLTRAQFAASASWRGGFLTRHRLSFRVKTHQGQEAPADAEARAAMFVQEVRAVIDDKGITQILNADQTAVVEIVRLGQVCEERERERQRCFSQTLMESSTHCSWSTSQARPKMKRPRVRTSSCAKVLGASCRNKSSPMKLAMGSRCSRTNQPGGTQT